MENEWVCSFISRATRILPDTVRRDLTGEGLDSCSTFCVTLRTMLIALYFGTTTSSTRVIFDERMGGYLVYRVCGYHVGLDIRSAGLLHGDMQCRVFH